SHSSLLSENHPQGARLARTYVLPPVGRATVEQRAVARLQRVRVAVVVEGDLAFEHVEELHLARLNDDLVGGAPARFGGQRETTAQIFPWKSPAPSTAQRSE